MKKTATQWGDESLAEAFHELMNVVINMRNAGVSLNQVQHAYPSGQLTFRTPALRTMVSAYF